ncbi:MAG: hypothetical protein AB7P14_11720 [Blastocatellales bacterium]
MRKPTIFRKALTVAVMMAVSSFYLLVTSSALAQTAAKAAGELSVTGNVTINGTQAISGATVFSESKVKTARNGAATVNLGKLGRVQLGPESEMVLSFADGRIGGNLTAGRAVVSTPAGVAISVATAEGVAVADGKDASTLTIDVTCGNTRVAAGRSDAKVTSGGKVEYVAAGSEVSVGSQAAPRCARLSTANQGQGLSPGAVAALIIAGVGGAVAGIVAASQSDNVTPSSIVVSGFRP